MRYKYHDGFTVVLGPLDSVELPWWHFRCPECDGHLIMSAETWDKETGVVDVFAVKCVIEALEDEEWQCSAETAEDEALWGRIEKWVRANVRVGAMNEIKHPPGQTCRTCQAFEPDQPDVSVVCPRRLGVCHRYRVTRHADLWCFGWFCAPW